MTDKKLIAVLRKACQYCNPTPCCEYELMGNEAADRIERLQAENTRLKAELDKVVEDITNIINNYQKYIKERDKNN